MRCYTTTVLTPVSLRLEVNMKSILLVRPASWSGMTATPTGLLCVASYLMQAGHTVKVLDLNCHDEAEVDQLLETGEYGIVGVSMLSFHRAQPYGLINRIKDTYGDQIKVVVGGVHATSVPDLLVDRYPVDAVVIGEGEITFKELADFWLKGEGGPLHSIRGLYTRENRRHPFRPVIADLDTMPLPDYGQLDLDQYYSVMVRNRSNYVHRGVPFRDAKFANLNSSRGCLGRCTFCNAFVHWRGETRAYSADALFQHLVHLHEQWGRNLFYFNDDAFGQDPQLVIDLCKKIHEAKLPIAWFADTRVDVVTDESLHWMSEAGCFCLSYGVESCSQTILDNMKKGTSVDQVVNAFAMTKKWGIKAYALLMIGNVGETDETIQETHRVMCQIQPDIRTYVGVVWVLPGTQLEQLYINEHGFDREYWATPTDGVPEFYHGFGSEDVQRWQQVIDSIPSRW